MSDPLARRELLKSAAIATGASLLASNLGSAADSPATGKCSPVAMVKAVVVTPTSILDKNVSSTLSTDLLSQQLLFSDLQVTFGPEMPGQKFVPVKTAFIEIPVKPGSDDQCELLGYTIDIRGTVTLSAGARGSVTVVVSGTAFQIDFPYDNALANQDFFKRFFALPRTLGTPGKTVIRSPLQIQIIVFVETAQSGDGAVLTVDSLDIEARRAY